MVRKQPDDKREQYDWTNWAGSHESGSSHLLQSNIFFLYILIFPSFFSKSLWISIQLKRKSDYVGSVERSFLSSIKYKKKWASKNEEEHGLEKNSNLSFKIDHNLTLIPAGGW